jgi:prophage regulatory protein
MYENTNHSPFDNSNVCPTCGATRGQAPITGPSCSDGLVQAKEPVSAQDYFNTLAPEAYVRQKLLLQIVPISNATLWRKVKSGEFPRPIKFSPMVTAWRVSEIRALLERFKGSKKQ